MNNNNLPRLEAEIRKALPELMELTEGCEVMTGGKIFIIGKDAKVVWPNKNEIEINGKWLNTFLIIGKPVTLLHLLRWLGEIGYGKIDTDFNLSFLGLEPMQWDYTKPLLRDQSQEVIDELCKLIN